MISMLMVAVVCSMPPALIAMLGTYGFMSMDFDDDARPYIPTVRAAYVTFPVEYPVEYREYHATDFKTIPLSRS